MSTRSFFLQFNAWEFRVVELEQDGNVRQIGKPSQDVQLALRSAVGELGGAAIFIPLQVQPT